MTQNQCNLKIIVRNGLIILLSIISLIACIVVLFFPQASMELIGQVLHRKITYIGAFKLLQSLAMGGICCILFFCFCTLTGSGRLLVRQVKRDIEDCLAAIDFRSLLKPVLLLSGVYLLGILTIIRANALYKDDIWRSMNGDRGWYDWSRWVAELMSIFIHADTNLTDISPLPQLLAVLMLSISSVFLVYIMGNGKITTVRLLASIPLGLSPFFLECLSFKFDAPYMALSVLASIIPFLFIARNRAFLFCSVISLLVMCMSYQAASGIYLLVVIIVCFQDWNSRRKTNKEILVFGGMALIAFCFALIFFRLFLMKPQIPDNNPNAYASTGIHPLPDMLSGILINIKNYITTINQDLGVVWKIGILFVFIAFVIKSIQISSQKKIQAFLVSMLVISLSFILSYGGYILLTDPTYIPRSLYGFGIFLAILCINVVSDYKKAVAAAVLALNWCFLIFAFSYGNALADHTRYANFRIGLLLHDLSALYPNQNEENIQIQLDNPIEFAPSIKNIAKHYPIIEKLIPTLFGTGWEYRVYMLHFNIDQNITFNVTNYNLPNYIFVDFKHMELPVVLDSYYHTIQSDGNYVLIILKH